MIWTSSLICQESEAVVQKIVVRKCCEGEIKFCARAISSILYCAFVQNMCQFGDIYQSVPQI